MTKSFIEQELEEQHIGTLRSITKNSDNSHKIIVVDNVISIIQKAMEELRKKRYCLTCKGECLNNSDVHNDAHFCFISDIEMVLWK